MDEIGDSDFYVEGVGNSISKIVTSINTLVKRLVENFSKILEKNKVDKTIKELEKLPKDTKVKVDIDMKTAAETYEDLIDEYRKVVKEPNKKSKIKDKVEKAHSLRKKILIGSGASVVTIGAILGWLKLLKEKNSNQYYKAIKLSDRERDVLSMYHNDISILASTKEKIQVKKRRDEIDKNMDERYDKARKSYEEYSDCYNALMESEYYRLTLSRNIFKSVRNISKFVTGTIKGAIEAHDGKRASGEEMLDSMKKTTDMVYRTSRTYANARGLEINL